jgi:beta-lactamase regulating signal transducer with metallopeptidase domain
MIERLGLTIACAVMLSAFASACISTVLKLGIARSACSARERHAVRIAVLCALALVVPLSIMRLWRGTEIPASSYVSQGAATFPGAAHSAQHVMSSGVGRFVSGGAMTIAALWVAGCLLGLCAFGVKLRRAEALKREAGSGVQDVVAASLRRVCLRMNQPMPSVTASASITVPSIVGVVHPVLVVPAALTSIITEREIDLVLAHEVAHIARRDPLWNHLQAVAGILLFHATSARALSADVRTDRELACDAAAASAFGQPLVLARALERIESARSGAGSAPAGSTAFALGFTDEPLLQRIEALVDACTNACTLDTQGLHPPHISKIRTTGAAAAVSAFALASSMVALPATSVDALVRMNALAAAFRQDIQAVDDAGPFTLEVDGYRAVAATVAGQPFPPSRIRQRGNAVRFTAADGSTLFAVRLRPEGGMQWNSRQMNPGE